MKDQHWLNATGDVVAGDTIRFTEAVFAGSHRKPKFVGNRTITAKVLRDSYGAERQQHTFSLEVLACEGEQALQPGTRTRRKGRNVYRNGCERLEWADEAARDATAEEKHSRGAAARAERERRRDEEVHLW